MFDVTKLKWTREPGGYDIKDNKIEIITPIYGKGHIIILEMTMRLYYR